MVARCWLIAAVKRIYNAGEPFHHVPVLEGGQAAGKSTTLRVLSTFGKDKPVSYFTDQLTFGKIDDPKTPELLRGKLFVEFAELSGLSKKDYNVVKQYITQTEDEIQRKYQNEITRIPRQFIICGTTNENAWLTDPTGNRRFWPVKVSDHIDLEALERDKEQLWAEAVFRAKAGEKHYITDENPIYELARQEQGERLMGDAWEDKVIDFIAGRSSVSTDEIMKEAVGLSVDKWDNRHRARVNSILRSNGWEQKISRKEGNRPKRLWCPVEKPAQEDLIEF